MLRHTPQAPACDQQRGLGHLGALQQRAVLLGPQRSRLRGAPQQVLRGSLRESQALPQARLVQPLLDLADPCLRDPLQILTPWARRTQEA